MTLDDTTKATLQSIEAMLVADRVSVSTAIEAAYRLGHLDGMVKMARVGEERVGELIEAAAAHDGKEAA